MPIDASIYNNVRPVAMPSFLDSQQKAMTLSNLGMRQMAMARDLQNQQAMREAYAKNIGADGQLNQQAFLSDLGRINPTAAIQMQKQFTDMSKSQTDAQASKVDLMQKTVNATMPAMEYLNKLPEDQRAQAYPTVMKQLSQQGVPMHNVPDQYDPNWFGQTYQTLQNTKGYLDQQVAKSEINKNNMESGKLTRDEQKLGAEELGKFKDDILNASSRKTTGSLLDTVNRADRITALSNVGAQPGETEQQRIQRLNGLMPQIAKEFNVSLAAIMQGGVPQETLIKETGIDTIKSKIADLEQQYSANPTASNQGALINEYVKAAQHLRDFAAGRLQDISKRARAAYPYANKYYGKQMDQVSAPLAMPTPGGTVGESALAQGGGGGFIPSAGASERMPNPQPNAGTNRPPSPNPKDAAALEWLKTADKSDPMAFKVRAKLKAKGLL